MGFKGLNEKRCACGRTAFFVDRPRPTKNTRVTFSLPECFALSFGVDDLFGVEELLLEEVADVVDIAS